MIAAASRATTEASAMFQRFARWWREELLALVPSAWRERNRRRIEAHIGDGSIRARICRGSATPAEGLLDISRQAVEPAEFAAILANACRSSPVWLCVPPAAILSRIVQVPRSAAVRFDNLLAVEADRWTPFSAAEIVAAWRVLPDSADNKSEVELCFVPRASIDRWTGMLASFGLAPSVAVLGDDHRLHAELANASTPYAKTCRERKRMVAAAAGAALLLAYIDWAAATHERNAWDARVSAERRQLARQQAVERRIEDVLAASAGAEETGKRPAAVLAGVSAALPASDWLTELALRDGTAALRGYSANVEALLKALEPLSMDKVVTIQGELAFDARLDRHRFAVAFRVGGTRR
jgi:general secretion pathway protein L